MSDARYAPVLHVFARRAPVPKVGNRVEVMLPGELISAMVDEVISDEVIVVTVDSLVTGKSGHGIKRGDPVACTRKRDELQIERWMPIDNREVRMREIAHRLAEEEAAMRALPPPEEHLAAPADPDPARDNGVTIKTEAPPAAARRRRKKA